MALRTINLTFKILNSYHLKIIALLTMIVDHVGFIFFPDESYLRIIGRLAFVLYAFMLVEGFFYTKNFKKYFSKLTLWAILSEIPFDLAVHGEWFYIYQQNIFFTLLLGLSGMYFIEKKKSIDFKIIWAVFFISAAYILQVDYSWYGLAIIFTFYYFRKNKIFSLVTIQALSLIASINILVFQLFAFLGFIPILMYNGKQGKKMGNFYYSFYAVHLAVFAVIKSYIDFDFYL